METMTRQQKYRLKNKDKIANRRKEISAYRLVWCTGPCEWCGLPCQYRQGSRIHVHEDHCRKEWDKKMNRERTARYRAKMQFEEDTGVPLTRDRYLARERRRDYNRLRNLAVRAGEWPQQRDAVWTEVEEEHVRRRNRVIQYSDFDFLRMLKGEIP